MTGLIEGIPGQGHNNPPEEGAEKDNQHWDRWAKKRTFVRALEGTYSHLYKSLVDQPRVFSSKDVPWKGGPGHYGKSVISPAGGQRHPIDREPHRGLRAERRRPEARPPQQRGVLRAEGPRP